MTSPTGPGDEDRANALGSAVPSLLPCPFCRSLSPQETGDNGGFFIVACMNCQARGPARTRKADAASDWNTRAPSPVSGGEEGLKAALENCQRVLAMLTEPEAIRSSSVQHAWAQAVDAELKARNALAALSKREKIEDRKSDDLLAITAEASFLIERLNDFERDLNGGTDIDKLANDYSGHVHPSLSRLTRLISQPIEASGSLKEGNRG